MQGNRLPPLQITQYSPGRAPLQNTTTYQEGSAPDCFVEKLVDKGAEESILMQRKMLPPLEITVKSGNFVNFFA
jgi:hypothetical protein